jgi:hypothetical protein
MIVIGIATILARLSSRPSFGRDEKVAAPQPLYDFLAPRDLPDGQWSQISVQPPCEKYFA